MKQQKYVHTRQEAIGSCRLQISRRPRIGRLLLCPSLSTCQVVIVRYGRQGHVSTRSSRTKGYCYNPRCGQPTWPTKGRVLSLSPLNCHLKFLYTFALKIPIYWIGNPFLASVKFRYVVVPPQALLYSALETQKFGLSNSHYMACGLLYKLESLQRRTDNNDNCSAALGQKGPQKQSQSIQFAKFSWGSILPQQHAHKSFAPPIASDVDWYLTSHNLQACIIRIPTFMSGTILNHLTWLLSQIYLPDTSRKLIYTGECSKTGLQTTAI